MTDTKIDHLEVPAHASANAKRVAETVVAIVAERLHDGYERTRATAHAAIGRDQVAKRLGCDRKTAAAGLAELVELDVLWRIGQLPHWVDPNGEPVNKTGAFVYCLGTLIHRVVDRLSPLKLPSTSTYAVFGGAGPRSRVRRCLRWAVRTAEEGCRNSIGHWLACRCTDAGLNEAETLTVLAEYQQGVPGLGYSLREARATVRSRFRALARA